MSDELKEAVERVIEVWKTWQPKARGALGINLSDALCDLYGAHRRQSTKTCETCQWYFDGTANDMDRTCRRRSPFMEHRSWKHGREGIDTWGPKWPPVGTHDFCGEWEETS